MVLLIQRVLESKIFVEEKLFSSTDKGLLIFVCFKKDDLKNQPDFDKVVKKVINFRIFEDENRKFNKSIEDVKGEIMLVSQFTLASRNFDGNRPSFDDSLPYEEAKILFEKLYEKFNEKIKTEKGSFGKYMKVHLVNDGPATFILEF